MPDPTTPETPETPEPEPAASPPPDGGTPDAPDPGDAPDGGATPDAPDADHGDPDTETESELVKKAVTVAELLIEKKYQEVKAQIAGRTPDGEQPKHTPAEADLILLQGYLTEGVPLAPGGTWPVDDLSAIDAAGKLVTVTGITDQEKKPGSERMIFTYEGKDEAGNPVTGKVDGGELASSRLVKHIDTIETHFDGKAKELVQWLSKGALEADLPMNADEVDALSPDTDDSEAEVTELPNGETGDRMVGVALLMLKGKLDKLPAEADATERKNLEDTIRRLEAAQAVPGLEGTFAQQIAVEHSLKQLGKDAPNSLSRAKNQFEGSLEQRKADFVARFEGKIPSEDLAKLAKFLDKKGDMTEKIVQLLDENPDSAWIKSLQQHEGFLEVLKRSTNETAFNAYIDQLVDTLPEEVKKAWGSKLQGALKYGGIGLGSILILALLAAGGSMTIAAKLAAGPGRQAS